MKDTKGVRQVLEEALLIWKQDYPKKDSEGGLDMDGYFKRLEETKESALAALQEIMLGMLPEKIKLGKAVYKNVGDGYASERIGYKHGFNDALADMEQNIRGGFNNG